MIDHWLPQGRSSHTQCRAEAEGRGQRQGKMLELELEQRGLQVTGRGPLAEHCVTICSLFHASDSEEASL